jgi:hypothetical protein
MKFIEAKRKVYNRGVAPDSFLIEIVEWARKSPDSTFEVNALKDIYLKVKPELGPYESLTHRKAVMLEVMRVLAGFESSWRWNEEVDTSRAGADTLENSEAGAWQVSYDARRLHPSLADFLRDHGITNGRDFQQAMKLNHPLAMEFVARLMRVNTKHNGPLYKGAERNAIRSSLRDAKHSIYPWLSRESVKEFEGMLE